MRRLPVFILIDSSASMMGGAISAVNTGLKSLVQTLRTNPFSLETVHLGIISYNTEATIVRPFGDLLSNDLIEIEAKGRSNFGLGLELLIEEMKNQIKVSTNETKGDWKPLIICMTDGRPSGAWRKKLKEFHKINKGDFVVCACGMKSNLSIVESFGGSLVVLNEKRQNSIYEFFRWVSSSISSNSTDVRDENNYLHLNS
jgi:uncharacterized protein YegL